MIEKINIPEPSKWEGPEISLARKLNEIIDVVNAREGLKTQAKRLDPGSHAHHVALEVLAARHSRPLVPLGDPEE